VDYDQAAKDKMLKQKYSCWITKSIIASTAHDLSGRQTVSHINESENNAYLKEIADICGIKKNLTFHLARHTFATMSLSKGVLMDAVGVEDAGATISRPHKYMPELRIKR
jgi:site-specific recombinase XerD